MEPPASVDEAAFGVNAGIYVNGETVTVDRDTKGAVTVKDGGSLSATRISGVDIEYDSLDNGGGQGQSGIIVNSPDASVTIGGGEEYFNINGLGYNTRVVLNLPAEERASQSSREFKDGVGMASNASQTLVKKAYVFTNGAGRSAYGYNLGTLVIEDSYFETNGRADDYSGALFSVNLTPTARTIGIQATGCTSYYFNNCFKTQDWGVFSLDSVWSSNTYIVNTDVQVKKNGYGIIAIGMNSLDDTTNKVFSYGIKIESATYGAVTHTAGNTAFYSMADLPQDVSNVYSGRITEKDHITKNGESYIAGAISALTAYCDMNAKPDNYNIMAAKDATFTTVIKNEEIEDTLKLARDDIATRTSTFDMAHIGYFLLGYAKGATIWLRSSNADFTLDRVRLESSSGVLLRTMYDSITGDLSRSFWYVAPEADNPHGMDVRMNDMNLTGDIIHEDYQRELRLQLKNTSIAGVISYSTVEEFRADISDYIDKTVAGDAVLKAKVDASSMKSKLVPDASYDCTGGISVEGSRGMSLSLDKDSVWIVTGDSKLTALSIADDAEIKAAEGARPVMTVDGVETAIKAGNYSGDIRLRPGK